MWAHGTAVLHEECLFIVEKKEDFFINIVFFHFKKLEKDRQIYPKEVEKNKQKPMKQKNN